MKAFHDKLVVFILKKASVGIVSKLFLIRQGRLKQPLKASILLSRFENFLF